MGETPEDIERDIRQTRAELTETVDAIGDKVEATRAAVRPQNLVRQRNVQICLGGLVAAITGWSLLKRRRNKKK